MFENTIKFCDELLSLGVPGFDLMVCKDGECVLRHMNGYSDVENKVQMNGKERYYMYSCSKVITCTAALQLWEKGMFSLEDMLSDYLPEFREMTVSTTEGLKKAENPILIKHLFEMTAGFSYRMNSPFLQKCKKDTNGECPTRETMKYLAKEPLLFEPGERWLYSLAHDVLAALVEVVSGEKFEDYVKKNIFHVLEMEDSTFMLPDSELHTLCEQYKYDSVEKVAVNVGKGNEAKFGSKYASGGAGCISTVEDYMKFLEALRTYKLLKEETVALMQTDRLSDAQRKTYTKRDTHGYGLGVRCFKKDGVDHDFGWGGAAGAYLAIDIEKKLSLYFGCHFLSSPIMELRAMIYRFVYAELFAPDGVDAVWESLKTLQNRNLTY